MKLQTIASIAKTYPTEPVFAFRPASLTRAIKFFCTQFNGHILYAVKTNPEKHVIQSMYAQGIRAFDVASHEEIRLTRELAPQAKLYFMHPIKSPYAIQQAYFNYGVRHFSLDSSEELNKILRATKHAKDLCLHLRLAIPHSFAKLNLAGKFGVGLHRAPGLLKKIRKTAYKLGTSFHVGSQCMHPDAYRMAIRLAHKVLNDAKVDIDFFNVGGGFPSIYPGMVPPPLENYFTAIHEEFFSVKSDYPAIQLLCEPGRSLVAESTSLIVCVELRKKNKLYINDGTYGSLFDAGIPQFNFPVRLLYQKDTTTVSNFPFSFFGPTCDSLDYMKGPFYLPRNIKTGDYIEIGQLGAYSRTLSTQFNGFKQHPGIVVVSDAPLLTMYPSEIATY
ncbi:ornithine decarboxylase [Candidatus Rickettsiella viridis]|uniref:Ornithine decarboxylase n=1 Tax=Candidatus Rickettsiella viridis TaxID=676208 RepID=A0A2Z5UX98_9COXI|nr:type III PLP-dependent enzyme [Candidatus Rickettsiella viridis]BBB15805.1 ornithine decarboxylase [Candidatus Rickettsiella viridis]